MKREWEEATKTGNIANVQALLDEGVDINSLDKYGQTALMNAAFRGDLELIKALVKHRANLNHTAKYRLTALMLAVINNHELVVSALLTAGADTQLTGSKGDFERTPLEYAKEHGFHDIAGIISNRTEHKR